MRNKTSEDAHFIAHYLARFSDSYESLMLGNKTQTNQLIAKQLNMGADSFSQLRNEYDGFYGHRTGYPNPELRKSRLEFKSKFEKISQMDYLERVKTILGI
jgi:hypothetical protein